MHRRESSVSLNRFGLGLPPPHSLTAVTTRLPYIVVLKAEKFIARDNRDNRAGFVKCGVVTPRVMALWQSLPRQICRRDAICVGRQRKVPA